MASVLFDVLRGLAALLVIVGHLRNLFFVDFPEITSHRLLLALSYIVTSAGHQAVILFFVLSGYFITGSIMNATREHRWSWTDYLTRRLVRLWVVLLPALLLGLFWDKLGIHVGHAPALYSGRVADHILGDVTQLLAPHIFFGNLFFVQNILVPTLGSNTALWSLTYEFWFYLLFPLGFFAMRRATTPLHRAVCVILFAAAAWFVRGVILETFPVWLAGTALFLLPPPSLSLAAARRARFVAAMVYLPLFFGTNSIHSLKTPLNDYLLALLTLALLWVLLSATEPSVRKSLAVRTPRKLARFSYTLYAVHLPLLIFMASLFVKESRWTPTVPHLLTGFFLLTLVLAYALAVAWLTEFRTDELRQRIERLFGLPFPASPLPSDPTSAAPASTLSGS